jgi:hypothetical protein
MYFALGLTVTEGADKRISEFETSRTVWIDQIKNGTDKNFDTDPTCLLEFKRWRGHFLKGCVPEIYNWQSGPKATEQSKAQFIEIMEAMHVHKEEGTVTLADVETCCTGRLSFCTYLVYSVCSAVGDITRMSSASLYTIIVIKLLLSVFHRAAHIPLSSLEIPLSLLCVTFIGVLYRSTVLFGQALESTEYVMVKGLKWVPTLMDRINEYINPETFWVITLQVLMFFLCHTWSASLISKDFWNRIFQKGELYAMGKAIGYIGVQISLMVVLPRFAPDFAAVMSLPPFFSQSNVGIVKSVASQVVDQAMVKAREEMAKRAQAEQNASNPEKEGNILSFTDVEVDAPDNMQGNGQTDMRGQGIHEGDMNIEVGKSDKLQINSQKGNDQTDSKGQDIKEGTMKIETGRSDNLQINNQTDTDSLKAKLKEHVSATDTCRPKVKDCKSTNPRDGNKHVTNDARKQGMLSAPAAPKGSFKKKVNKMPKPAASALTEVPDKAKGPTPSPLGKSVDKAPDANVKHT